MARSTVAASDAKAEEEDGAGESAGNVKKYEGSAELATQLEAAGDAVAEYLNEALKTWEPPKFMWRTLYTLLLLGLVVKRVVWQRKLNMQQTLQQIARVGPDTLGVAMLTSSFVGMVFTIQFCKEFSKVGLTRVIGGLLGLAFTRELTPVICAIVLAGRVGMRSRPSRDHAVSEQVDQLGAPGRSVDLVARSRGVRRLAPDCPSCPSPSGRRASCSGPAVGSRRTPSSTRRPNTSIRDIAIMSKALSFDA